MDVRHPPFLLSLVLTTASLGALLTGCSYAPAKTESAAARPGYQAPQPVAATAPAATQRTNTGASTAAATGQSAAAAQQSTPAQPASTAKAVKPAPAPQPVAARPVTTKPAAIKPAAAQPAAAQPDAAQTKSASTPGASSTTASATRPVAASKPATAAKPLPQPAPLATSQPAAAPEFRREAAEATEATTTALATVQHTAPTAPPRTDTIKVSLNNLPLTIHDHWILDRTETQCLLKNTPVKMDDGQGGTSITLLLTPGSLQINTESDIDTSYTGTGITIDNQHHFALETVERRTNLSFSKQRQSLLASMQTGQQLQLTLGFWPTWPVTHTYSVNLPLQHFASAQKAWETCNQLLSRK